jgi:hypothetical protein
MSSTPMRSGDQLRGDVVGGLRLTRVQPEGQAPMEFAAFARGARLGTSERLGSLMATARGVAWHALQRIDQDGAYANLVLPGLLAGSKLDERDRAFVTDLVYGTTRMRARAMRSSTGS